MHVNTSDLSGVHLGLDTFGDITVDSDDRPLTAAQTIRNVVDQAVLADEVGLSFFGVGEHHRPDFAVSSPEIVLAAAAAASAPSDRSAASSRIWTSESWLSGNAGAGAPPTISTSSSLSGGAWALLAEASSSLSRISMHSMFPSAPRARGGSMRYRSELL